MITYMHAYYACVCNYGLHGKNQLDFILCVWMMDQSCETFDGFVRKLVFLSFHFLYFTYLLACFYEVLCIPF